MAAGGQSFSSYIDLDCRKAVHKIDSQLGDLDLVWTGSNVAGVSTLLRDGVTVNAAVHLPGKDAEEETRLLQYYIDAWREFTVVKELKPNAAFESALTVSHRPFVCSVNWATLLPDDYDVIAHYDLFVSAAYFKRLDS